MGKTKTIKTNSCSVEGCGAAADWRVYLHDEYGGRIGAFHEEDFTCPRLCDRHKQENEAGAKGVKRPRGVVNYPHTNQHGAQGWTEYEPVPSGSRA